MSANGLDVFDKTLQTTHIWLDDIMKVLGPDRQVAWHVLGSVLRAIRDRLPPDLAAHLGAQLPLLIRGAYYDRYRPSATPVTELSARRAPAADLSANEFGLGRELFAAFRAIAGRADEGASVFGTA